jgi:hypothetical protein
VISRVSWLGWLDSYAALLVTLLVLLVAEPILGAVVPGGWLLEVALVVVLVTAMARITRQRRGLGLTLIVGVPAVLGRVVIAVLGDPPGLTRALIFTATALLLLRIVVAIGRHVLTAREVTGDILAGAVCLYLLLGLMWAIAYAFLLALDPGAFAVADHLLDGGAGRGPSFSAITYFSFVTLTTLGYGEMSPITPIARNLAWLEAVVGQLFVAITIARLVAMNIAHRASASGPPDSP